MAKKLIMLFLILSSSTSFVASEVAPNDEKSEVSDTSELVLESEADIEEVSSDESVLEETNENEVISDDKTEDKNENAETVSVVSPEKTEVKAKNTTVSSNVVKSNQKSQTTKVIQNYHGQKGETLTLHFTNGVKTRGYLTDASGKRIKSWNYYSSGEVKSAYIWNGTVRLESTDYEEYGKKTAVYTYHKNNQVKEVVKYLSNGYRNTVKSYDAKGNKIGQINYNSKGKKHRSYKYFTNGKIKEQVKYSQNNRTETVRYDAKGKRTEYYTYFKNDYVKSKILYTSGTRNQTIFYDGFGRRTSLYTYDNKGKVKQKVIYYTDDMSDANGYKYEAINYDSKGLRTKMYTYYESGRVQYVDYYKKGKLNLSKGYFDDTSGKIAGKGTYYSNGNSNTWISYYKSGQVASYDKCNKKGEYVHTKVYYENGQLDYQIFYKNGKYYKIEEYNKSGQLTESIDYTDPISRKLYNKNGNVIKSEVAVDESYCKGSFQGGSTCVKVKEYNNWGSVTKTYYEYSHFG